MSLASHRLGFVILLIAIVGSPAAGCGSESGSEGLSVDVGFAPGVPRAARDEAIRVEVYLVGSCDSVVMGDRPEDAFDSMFVLRDGSAGPAIGIPEPGEYGLYAVALDSNCAVVGAGCDDVRIDAAPQESYTVELGSFSGAGCFANQQCSIETGECTGPSGDCVDLDSDGLGDGTLDNVGCVDATTDSNDGEATICADTDGDSCDDCSSGSFDPLDDGVDSDDDGICDPGDVCVDSDGDGLGDGTGGNVGCAGTTTDSNDGEATVCADTDGDSCDDCVTGTFDPNDDGLDGDGDGICDAGDVCVDVDGDGLGDGTGGNVGCAGTTTDSNDGEATVCADTDGDSCDDCVTGTFDPNDDGVDSDADGICDLSDDCVDADGDGLGDGTGGNVGCLGTTTDTNDGDATICADTDVDGCDDCAVAAFDPSNDGTDSDGDGVCALSDCDDDKPLCAAVCTDVDDDGYCTDTDCEDSVPSCGLDCVTNTDSDSHVDCFESFCGSDPADSGSECLAANDEIEYEAAIDAANANPGHDYIVLLDTNNDFTVTSDPPGITDDAGVTIRQVAGATVRVNSGGDRLVFKLDSHNNVIDGVRIVNELNARDLVQIKGDDNIVQNSVFLGFERRGIFVDGGDGAQLLNNIITGGINSQADDSGAIILKTSVNSIAAGNTLVNNAMDGLQVRQSIAPVIDHNTIADNGGSGIEFYGADSSGVCLRNNNVTGNADFGLHARKVVTFDDTASCTAPLSSGPTYGNNDFDNTGGSCGGNECLDCGCLPAGSFWGYSVDPLYTSTSVDDRDLYCLGAASTLIDGGDDLLAYDLNGDAAGDFNGSSPDIGSREDGPGDCD